VPGWQALRSRLVGEGGLPMLYFLDCCEDSIRTIPLLQHDELNPEDVDTEGEDHAGDDTRYACMSRPWVPGADPDSLPQEEDGKYTFNAILAKIRHSRLNRMAEHG